MQMQVSALAAIQQAAASTSQEVAVGALAISAGRSRASARR